jgi:phosphate uptake regulator
MKRRVVKHGLSTFIISLPSGWVKRYKVQRGDELEVEENGPSVIVHSGRAADFGSVEVDVSGLDRSSIMYTIRSLYKLGYDEIDLSFKQQSTMHYRLGKERTMLSIIHEELNRLIGLEVITQRENHVVLKSLSEMHREAFDATLRRAWLLLLDMSEDLIRATAKKDEELMSTMHEKHNTITKLLSYCIRMLNKHGMPDQRLTLMTSNVLMLMDKITDVIKDSGRLVLTLKPDVGADARQMMQLVHESIQLCYKLYYEPDNKSMQRQSELRDTILKRMHSKCDKYDKKEMIVVLNYCAVVELVQAIVEMSIAITHRAAPAR